MCFSALCEKVVFFIKEVLILNKDTKLLHEKKFTFALQHTSCQGTKLEKKNICPEHLPVVTT